MSRVVDVSYGLIIMSESEWHRMTYGCHVVSTRATLWVHADNDPPSPEVVCRLVDQHARLEQSSHAVAEVKG